MCGRDISGSFFKVAGHISLLSSSGTSIKSTAISKSMLTAKRKKYAALDTAKARIYRLDTSAYLPLPMSSPFYARLLTS